MQSHLDWGVMVYGILAIAVGLLFALSPGFAGLMMKHDESGRAWSALFGRSVQTRFLVSIFSLVVGGFCIYLGFHPEK